MSSCGGLDNGSKRSHFFEGCIGFGQLHGLREDEEFCDQRANDAKQQALSLNTFFFLFMVSG